MSNFEIRGDVLVRYDKFGEPLPGMPQQYRLTSIISREMFRACYNKWIINEMPDLSKIDSNVILAKIIRAFHDNEYPEYFQDEVCSILKEADLI